MESASGEAPWRSEGLGLLSTAGLGSCGQSRIRTRGPWSELHLLGGSSGLSAPHAISPCCTKGLCFPSQVFRNGGRKRQKIMCAFLPAAPAPRVPRGALISSQAEVCRVLLLSAHFANSQKVFSSVWKAAFCRSVRALHREGQAVSPSPSDMPGRHGVTLHGLAITCPF